MDKEEIVRRLIKLSEHAVQVAGEPPYFIMSLDDGIALEEAVRILKEQDAEVNDRQKKVEFIESYIKIGDGNYEWNDNHGELIRCKDCIHWDKGITEECTNSDSVCFHNGWCKPDWFCADGKRREADA